MRRAGALAVVLLLLPLLAGRGSARAAGGDAAPGGGDAGAPAPADAGAGAHADASQAPAGDALPAPVAAPPPAPPSRPRAAAAAPYETVVTAPPPAAHAPREDRAAAASVVLPGASPRAYDDLGTLLVEVPGVNVTRSGSLGSVATLALRGSNPDEVRIYVDGVPLAIAQGGAIDISTLPLGDVERVEVYRGTTPLAFAESALGGIVSITTRTPGVPRASARAGVGSFDTVLADASGGGAVGRLRLYAGAHALRSRGGFGFYQDACTAQNPTDDDPAAVRANNDVAQADAVVRATVALSGRRTLGAGAVAMAREQGLPGTCARPGSARFRTARALAYARYEARDDLGPGGRLALQLFGSAARDALDDQVGDVNSFPSSSHDTTLSAGATAHARRAFAPWLAAAAVFEGRAETFRAVDDFVPMASGVPARRLVGVVGAELDLAWQLLGLDVIPSVRVEMVQDVVTGRDTFTATPRAAADPITRTLPVLRLGLVRRLGGAVAIKANAGRYARVPSFLELYGNNGRVVGNPGLGPERGLNADLAVWVDVARAPVMLASRTTAFAARVEDLITWTNTPYFARAQQIDAARILGLEQEVRLGVGRHARLAAQATLMRAEDPGPPGASHGLQLPSRPRWRLYARPELVRVSVGGAVELGAFVDGDFVAGRYADSANLTPLPRRLLVGAGVTVDIPRLRARLAASAQNLGDSRVGDLPSWPLPGRSAFLTLAWLDEFGGGSTHPRSD